MKGGNKMTKNWTLYIARKEAGHSQTIVAKKLGITKERYGLKELNKAHFTIPEAKILSELYGMTLDELFGNEIKIGS
jgi:putative transcriptional regulator